MKGILVAPPSEFTDQLQKALIKNGVDLYYLSDRINFIIPLQSNFWWKIVRRLNVLRRINNHLFQKKLLALAKKVNPSFILINKGMIVQGKTMERLSSLGAKLVNWFPDNAKNEPYRSWIEQNSKYYDYFFSFDSEIVGLNDPALKTKYIYLPFGIDTAIFSSIKLNHGDIEKYTAKLCFIGAYYPEREEFLATVKKYGLKIFGWKGWEKSSLADCYYGPLNLEESAKAYSCAEICINMNTVPSVNGVNLKTFEIAAAGGFQISDHRKDLNGLLDIDKEIVIFSSKEQLKEKVAYYLINKTPAKEIANAGKVRVVRDHTIEKRVIEILDTIRAV